MIGRFHMGAPSMVFGPGTKENVRRLAGLVDHVEIVLFHTPTLHNIPGKSEMEEIRAIAGDHGLTLSIHLPTCMEIASDDPGRRRASLAMAASLVNRFQDPAIRNFILHIPYDRPTLAAVPGRYFHAGNRNAFAGWLNRARDGLRRLRAAAGSDAPLLVENINFSPVLMQPLWEEGRCGFCLDIGHLLLGREPVLPVMDACLTHILEIHLHGVVGHEEHLDLNVLPMERVRRWMGRLTAAGFRGVVNLEVFSPADLTASLEMVRQATAENTCKDLG